MRRCNFRLIYGKSAAVVQMAPQRSGLQLQQQVLPCPSVYTSFGVTMHIHAARLGFGEGIEAVLCRRDGIHAALATQRQSQRPDCK